jgi:hypothetical protein
MSLVDLIRKDGLSRIATVTPATSATFDSAQQASVAEVATVTVRPRQIAEQKLMELLSELPVSLEEILSSQLFDEFDFLQIANGCMNREGLLMYIASWLIAGKYLPCVLHHDWRERLGLPEITGDIQAS